jgi:hypothetical protein
VRARAVTLVGADRPLRETAPRGSRTLVLDDVTAIVAGTILSIGGDAATELVRVAGAPAASAVPLEGPLVRGYVQGTPVKRASLGAAGPARRLTRDANAGDGLLLLDATTTARWLEIGDPLTADVEYRAKGALADAAGYYALDGIGGVAAIDVVAAPPVGAAGPKVSWAIDYGRPVNVVDLQLAP